MKQFRWIFVVVLAICGALSIAAPTARADAEPRVNDEAHFFKPETITTVDAEVKALKADTHLEIVVESFAGIPEGRKAEWDSAKDNDSLKHDFYQSWIESRGHELKLNGVYVLIVRNPGHVEILAGKKTQEKAFPKADQDRMSSMLLDGFKAKQYDEGLTKAIDFARDAIKRNLNGAKHTATAGYDPFQRSGYGGGPVASNSQRGPPVNSGVPTQSNNPVPVAHRSFSCMWIVLIIIGVFVLLKVIGGMAGSRNQGGGGPGYGGGQGYGNPGYGGGGGYGNQPRGGGFMSGIFGGLLGGAAGSYIENRMENRHGNDVNTGGGGVPPTDAGYNPPAQNDYGSSGGDFGSSDSGSSGGDFGGGGGGSDSGSSGGDFGGGGGDSGGSSGGDF